jgi:hypothetical protein
MAVELVQVYLISLSITINCQPNPMGSSLKTSRNLRSPTTKEHLPLISDYPQLPHPQSSTNRTRLILPPFLMKVTSRLNS